MTMPALGDIGNFGNHEGMAEWHFLSYLRKTLHTKPVGGGLGFKGLKVEGLKV